MDLAPEEKNLGQLAAGRTERLTSTPNVSGGSGPACLPPPRRGVPYIPRNQASLPATTAKKGRKWWLLVVACAVATVGIGVGIKHGTSSAPPPPTPPQFQAAPRLQHQQVLFVSNQDLDKEATAKAQAALQRGEIPPVLATAPLETREQIQSGEQAIFKLHIIDSQAEDGDAVSLFLNGLPSGEVTLSHLGADLNIALKPNSTASLKIVASRDGGGGGVTFGASSSQGELRTRTMHVGESEEWIISYK